MFYPKHVGANKKFEKNLTNTESFEKEVRGILEENRITPSKVVISKAGSGRGSNKLGDMFEGFSYKRFRGKVRGEKRGLFRTKPWKSDFSIYLLSGTRKNRDGILFRTEEADSKEKFLPLNIEEQ